MFRAREAAAGAKSPDLSGIAKGRARVIELNFRIDKFEAKAAEIGGALDQVPFALSLALNDAARAARQVLVQETWPKHVTQRNSAFIGRALRTVFATKHSLRVEIYDDLNRGHLALHATGGTKEARKRFAIPVKGRIARTAHGVRSDQTPTAIIANRSKRDVRITPRGIFVAEGGKLHLMYAFAAKVFQPKDVPFEEDFATAVVNEVRTSFPEAMKRAMATRR